MKSDIAIIGGGIIGVSLGFHLAQSRQSLRVIILEREHQCGLHASGRNAGMIRHLHHHEQLTTWVERSLKTWPQEIRSRCFVETGSLIAPARKPAGLPPRTTQVEMSLAHDLPTQVFAVAQDGLLDSPTFMEGLTRLASESGVKILSGKTVRHIEQEGELWKLTLVNTAQHLHTRVVFLTAGAWSQEIVAPYDKAQLLTAFSRHIGIIEGQITAAFPSLNSCGFLWNEKAFWYVRRLQKSSDLASAQAMFSICDSVPTEPSRIIPEHAIDETVRATMEARLHELIANPKAPPHLAQIHKCWRSYRPNELPLFGLDRQWKNLFWLTGFGGFGMSTGYAAAKDAADLFAGKDVWVPPEFLP